MSQRVLTTVGLVAAGGGAYYLYSAGGNPKLAEKKLEHDAATAARKIRGDIPGQDKEAKKAGEEGFEAMRAKAQGIKQDAKVEANRLGQNIDHYKNDAERKLEEVRRTTGKDVNAAADKFDKTVLDEVEKSKSWVGSWFGGK
ncbi:hypothetical protein BDV95DRAFT_279776 [Massariosphaeria phaeospora]|uniref:Calcofluor white hypersensitive protein n=1 Tax=Massariosphaeria phaeospora TaxID=100035 RepID=A0A7C8MV04_9PLEO|nr:hypothetical protein BDV95DRAFT_279776 [Massariosphaeria phaeospora]